VIKPRFCDDAQPLETFSEYVGSFVPLIKLISTFFIMVIQNMCKFINNLGAYIVISTNDEYTVVTPGYTAKILPVKNGN
jgi:hypothetical protein